MSKGIRVFNPSSLSMLANNKQLCYEFMYKNGIEILPINYSEIPAVKKPIDGHGGQNVTMINKKKNLNPVLFTKSLVPHSAKICVFG